MKPMPNILCAILIEVFSMSFSLEIAHLPFVDCPVFVDYLSTDKFIPMPLPIKNDTVPQSHSARTLPFSIWPAPSVFIAFIRLVNSFAMFPVFKPFPLILRKIRINVMPMTMSSPIMPHSRENISGLIRFEQLAHAFELAILHLPLVDEIKFRNFYCFWTHNHRSLLHMGINLCLLFDCNALGWWWRLQKFLWLGISSARLIGAVDGQSSTSCRRRDNLFRVSGGNFAHWWSRWRHSFLDNFGWFTGISHMKVIYANQGTLLLEGYNLIDIVSVRVKNTKNDWWVNQIEPKISPSLSWMAKPSANTVFAFNSSTLPSALRIHSFTMLLWDSASSLASFLLVILSFTSCSLEGRLLRHSDLAESSAPELAESKSLLSFSISSRG